MRLPPAAPSVQLQPALVTPLVSRRPFPTPLSTQLSRAVSRLQPGLQVFMGKGKAVWTATRKALTDLFTTSDGESPKRMSRPPCNSLRSAALRSTVRFDSFHLPSTMSQTCVGAVRSAEE